MKDTAIQPAEYGPDDRELICMVFEDGRTANEFMVLGDDVQTINDLLCRCSFVEAVKRLKFHRQILNEALPN